MRMALSVLLMCWPPAPLAFGGGHALHAVSAGLEAKLLVDPFTLDAQHQFLVATQFGVALAQDLRAPALPLAPAQVHARQVTGKQGRFIPTGAGTDFKERVALIIRVARDQCRLQLRVQTHHVFAGRGDFLLRHLGHFRVGQHGLGRRQISFALLVAAEIFDDTPHLRLFARKAAVALDVTGHLRVGQRRIQLRQTQGQAFELFAQGRVHEE
jgi:hypothetical protein